MDYAEIAADALESIAEAGQKIPLKRKTQGAYNPVLGSHAPGAEQSSEFSGVVLELNKGNSKAFSDSIIERLRKGKGRLILAATDAEFPPEPEDLVYFDGGEWLVIGCSPLAPSGLPLLYKLGVLWKGDVP